MASSYYEYLRVSQDAPDSVIRAALERLIAESRLKLGNPMTMQSARQVLNEIVPGIQRHLLSGPATRERLCAGRKDQNKLDH